MAKGSSFLSYTSIAPVNRLNRVMSRPNWTGAEIAAGLEDLAAWSVENSKLHREYKFPYFAHAIAFIASCAPLIACRSSCFSGWKFQQSLPCVLVSADTQLIGCANQRELQQSRLLFDFRKQFSIRNF